MPPKVCASRIMEAFSVDFFSIRLIFTAALVVIVFCASLCTVLIDQDA